jgi:hypothetical protein
MLNNKTVTQDANNILSLMMLHPALTASLLPCSLSFIGLILRSRTTLTNTKARCHHVAAICPLFLFVCPSLVRLCLLYLFPITGTLKAAFIIQN